MVLDTGSQGPKRGEQGHLRDGWKCRFLSRTPDPLSQSPRGGTGRVPLVPASRCTEFGEQPRFMTSSRLALSLIDLVEALFYTLELAKSEIVRSYVCYLRFY